MDQGPHSRFAMTRRELFRGTGTGIGAIALAALLDRDRPASAAALAPTDGPGTPPRPHFAPKAKHVIFLHMVVLSRGIAPALLPSLSTPVAVRCVEPSEQRAA